MTRLEMKAVETVQREVREALRLLENEMSASPRTKEVQSHIDQADRWLVALVESD